MSHSPPQNTYEDVTDVAHFASCRTQFMKNALKLFSTTSITLFLAFPVSLYTVSSLDKKFILAPVKVQPEKH